MKLTAEKIREILKNFSMTLEQRDREDIELYGWKGGEISSYRTRRMEDYSIDEDKEE